MKIDSRFANLSLSTGFDYFHGSGLITGRHSPVSSMRLAELFQFLFRAVADRLASIFRIGGVVRQQLHCLLRILTGQIVLPVGKVRIAKAVVNIG